MDKKSPRSALFKWFLVVAGLGTAVGGPMAISSLPGWWSSLVGGGTSSQATGATARAGGVGVPADSAATAADGARLPGASPEKPEAPGMADVFRFDVTLRELMGRWPRVSTSLPDLELQGYRVPLVTGTAQTDLAGSLTYYFNSRQQVQRIAFSGTTGDGRELVRLLGGRFGFQRRLTDEPSLFLYEVPVRRGHSPSVLRLKVAPLLKSSRPHQRFDVWLVIERPQEQPVISRVLGQRG